MADMASSPSLDFNVSSEKVQKINAAFQKISRDSFLVFARGITIPSVSGPVMFDRVMAKFQRKFFEDIAASLHALRDGTIPPNRRFWLERTKKTSKDNDVAVCLLWLMAFTDRPLLGQVCAANSEQAAIIEDRARAIMHYNKWLNSYVEIVQRVIRSRAMPKGTRVQIEATGSAGAAQGPTPDILVLNELVHVDRWDVMKAHMNNAAGVPRGVVVVATNAGVKGTPAEVWRQNAFENRERWRVHHWKKKAPWLSNEDMEEAKRLDPIGAEFRRLWQGRWVSGSGGAVDEDTIDRAFRLSGPLSSKEKGWRYLAGLDLGVSHDHAGIAVVGVNEQEQSVREVWIRGYVPEIPNDKGVLEVDCSAVEEDVERVTRVFDIEWFGYDPAAGGSFMAQRLRKRGIRMREVSFSSPAQQTAMAVAFVTLMKDGKLACYEDEEGRMRRDFGKFSIEHKPPSKYKLTAISDEHGHADVGVSLVMTLPRAVEILGGISGLLPSDVLVEENDEDLSEEEVKEMPDELRAIYEMEAEDFGVKPKRVRLTDLDTI